MAALAIILSWQPPSGGCVLKPYVGPILAVAAMAAAFGRLCVETLKISLPRLKYYSAAFGRLCVETAMLTRTQNFRTAAAFGRLCVETMWQYQSYHRARSRLRAAVC